MPPLRTEADLIRTLQPGSRVTLQDLYRMAEETGLADRPGGRTVIQDGKEQYKRRVRTALYQARRTGRASRLDDGEPGWIIEGTVEKPRRCLFVWLPRDPSQLELVLGDVEDILRRSPEPIDLVFTDPPFGLDRDGDNAGRRTYGRNHDQVVPGYVDVDPAEYEDFTARWIGAAHDVIRPGGYLAVVTGPDLAADVQVAAKGAGLTFVNSITVTRPFGLYATRRFVHSQWRITLMAKGPYGSKHRHFDRPPEFPRGPKGQIYAVDVWHDIPENRRPGLLRYDNSIHWTMPDRIIRAVTRPGDIVADPFMGGGPTPEACLRNGRRFYGGDLNPNALRYTMGRLISEVTPSISLVEPDFDLGTWSQLVLDTLGN